MSNQLIATSQTTRAPLPSWIVVKGVPLLSLAALKASLVVLTAQQLLFPAKKRAKVL